MKALQKRNQSVQKDLTNKFQKIMKKLVLILTTFMALSFSQSSTAQGTIVDVAVGNENFTTKFNGSNKQENT